MQQFLNGDTKPTFSLKGVDITKITLENISLKVLTNVKNYSRHECSYRR